MRIRRGWSSRRDSLAVSGAGVTRGGAAGAQQAGAGTPHVGAGVQQLGAGRQQDFLQPQNASFFPDPNTRAREQSMAKVANLIMDSPVKDSAGIVSATRKSGNTKTPPDFSGGVRRFRSYASTVAMTFSYSSMLASSIRGQISGVKNRPLNKYKRRCPSKPHFLRKILASLSFIWAAKDGTTDCTDDPARPRSRNQMVKHGKNRTTAERNITQRRKDAKRARRGRLLIAGWNNKSLRLCGFA